MATAGSPCQCFNSRLACTSCPPIRRRSEGATRTTRRLFGVSAANLGVAVSRKSAGSFSGRRVVGVGSYSFEKCISERTRVPQILSEGQIAAFPLR